MKALQAGRGGDVLSGYEQAYEASWVQQDLKRVRNAKPLWSRFGTLLGDQFDGAGFVRGVFIAVVSALILKTAYDAFLRGL